MARPCGSCLPSLPGFLFVIFCCSGFSATLEQVGPNLALVEPFGIAFDSAGNSYICEYKGQKITKLGKDGIASRFAGTGTPGYGGDGGPAQSAALHDPHGLLIGPNDQMYIADTLNNRVRQVDIKSGIISTLAGTGEKGFSGDGGPATQAAFDGVFGIALTNAGDKLFVADLGNRRVRMIDLKTGVICTVAGNGKDGIPAQGAIANQSSLQDPRAVAIDSRGSLYILERRGNALRVVDSEGKIRTLITPAITPASVSPDLNGPKYLCIDRDDNIVIADSENHQIRKYSLRDGSLVTVVGTGQAGNRLSPRNPLDTQLNRPHGVIVNQSGDLFIVDSYNNRILKLVHYNRKNK